jgi:hypothetical protein
MNDGPAVPFPSPPRAVRRKVGGGCALGFGRLFILPHMIIGIGSLLTVPTRCYVYNFGTHVQATIHKLERRTSRKGGDYYVVGFDYTLGWRRYAEEYESLSVAEGAHTRVGDKLDGRAAALLGHALFLRTSLDIRSDLLGLGTWSLLWNGFVWTVMYIIWVVPIRGRLLAKNGPAAPGVITSRKEKRGRGSTYTLFYTFRTAAGHLVRAKSDVRLEGYRAAYEGAPVTVIYDPRKPTRSLPYEFSDFIVAEVGRGAAAQMAR